jgi:hypothetical protein
MSKRSPDPTSPLTPPLPKHARRTPSRPLKMISEDELKELYGSLTNHRAKFSPDHPKYPCVGLHVVYINVKEVALFGQNDGIVEENQFNDNIIDKPAFFAMIMNIVDSELNEGTREQLKALLHHGVCFYFGANQVVNVL